MLFFDDSFLFLFLFLPAGVARDALPREAQAKIHRPAFLDLRVALAADAIAQALRASP